MSKLGQLTIKILVYRVETFLKLFFSKLADGVMSRIVVYVWKEDCLGEGWSDVFSGASITVSTSSNLGREM